MSILENRTLGKSGIKVSPMGLGCWAIGGLFKMGGMSDGYGPVDDEESIRAINKAIDMGITFLTQPMHMEQGTAKGYSKKPLQA